MEDEERKAKQGKNSHRDHRLGSPAHIQTRDFTSGSTALQYPPTLFESNWTISGDGPPSDLLEKWMSTF